MFAGHEAIVLIARYVYLIALRYDHDQLLSNPYLLMCSFQSVNAKKQSWTDSRLTVVLRVVPYALEQLNERGVLIASYPFRNIKNIGKVGVYTSYLYFGPECQSFSRLCMS